MSLRNRSASSCTVRSTIATSSSPDSPLQDRNRRSSSLAMYRQNEGHSRHAFSPTDALVPGNGASQPSPSASQTTNDACEDGIRRGLKVTSRVHRACTACRRQKMRCEGPVNGPCHRCQASQQECIFERPPKDSGNGGGLGDAAMARLAAIELQMSRVQSTLVKLTSMLESLTPTSLQRAPPYDVADHKPVIAQEDKHSPQHAVTTYRAHSRDNLSIPSLTSSTSCVRKVSESKHFSDKISPVTACHSGPPEPPAPPLSAKRSFADALLDNEEDSTDREADFTNDELGAPIEALRGLADAATARLPPQHSQEPSHSVAGKRTSFVQSCSSLNDHRNNLQPHLRKRKLSKVGDWDRDALSARSKQCNIPDRWHTQPKADVMTLGIVSRSDAERLWTIFMQGCPKFIGVFSPQVESRLKGQGKEANQSPTMSSDWASSSGSPASPDRLLTGFEETRISSPFLFATILAVGAKVGLAIDVNADLAQRCMKSSQRHAQGTLLCPSASLTKEDVMALNLVASYCDSGWVLVGHAVRVAQELRLDLDFKKLQTESLHDRSFLAKSDSDAVRIEAKEQLLCERARGARLWFFTFLLEHQISYGAGKPAMLHRDLVDGCRDFLKMRYPLTSPIDIRFISTLELMVIREQHHDCLAPFDAPIDESMHGHVNELNEDLHAWMEYWSLQFRNRGHADDSFFLGSLRLQCATAKMYLTCTVLRKIGSEDGGWSEISQWRRSIVSQAVKAADQTLRIAVQNKEYFELLMWAPHYTIVTATFSAVFLLKALRLYPTSQLITTRGLQDIFKNAERLAKRFLDIPSASKYGVVILQMLWHAFKFIVGVNKRKGLSVIFGTTDATANGTCRNQSASENSNNLPKSSPIQGNNVMLQKDTPQSDQDTLTAADNAEYSNADMTDIDAIIAAIDWDKMEQADFKQVLYELDQKHQGQPQSRHNLDASGTDAFSEHHVSGAEHVTWRKILERPRFLCGTSSADRMHRISDPSPTSNLEKNAAPHSNAWASINLPAWVQPHSFEDVQQPDWPINAGLPSQRPQHPISGFHANEGSSHSFSKSCSVENGQDPRSEGPSNTGPMHCLSQRPHNTFSRESEGAKHIEANYHLGSQPASISSGFTAFEQIAHELDLSETLADLFAPSANALVPKNAVTTDTALSPTRQIPLHMSSTR